jgi:ubiquinone/menaquinone biosynthesis C-methylase UbiE
MDYRRYETNLAKSYDCGADQYRRDDEIEARSENHQRLGGNLRRMCRSFSRPVRVLEMGCGTGRYFHWLENTELLVGTDISAEMLRQAKTPVHAAEVTAAEIRLIRGNLYEMNFEPGSFDIIYSLGVFGYGAAITEALCAKLESWLAPGGRLYFDALERRDSGRVHELKQSVKSAVLPLMPGSIRQRVEARRREAVPVFNHTRAQIEELMTAAGFADFVISSNTCHSPLWTGMHLECSARKVPVGDRMATVRSSAQTASDQPAGMAPAL